MEHLSVTDVDSQPSAAAERRAIGPAVGLEGAALNYYELAPGDSFAFGYHAHKTQEEMFYVIEGEAVFETEEGTVTVGAGEAVYFSPGEYQRGVNEGDERVVALALGSPAESGETEVLRECADCKERTVQQFERAEEGELVTLCVDCGAETGRFD